MFATAAIWSRCISGRIIGRMRDMNKKKLRILALIISVMMLLAGQQILTVRAGSGSSSRKEMVKL
jgi:hypothetical protein